LWDVGPVGILAAAMEETTVWRGHSSQILNLRAFLIYAVITAVIIAALVLLAWKMYPLSPLISIPILLLVLIPMGLALRDWLKIQSRVYDLTNERILITHGIFSKQTDTMELYRVKDFTVLQPFFLRLFSLGNIVIQTSDRTTPTLMIEAVPDPKGLGDLVRKQVEACRDRKRVGEVDMNKAVEE
jgi:membrane protein YdbS with pleckstrin-like domain